MYRIRIKGEAKTDFANLSKLDGVDCPDCFSEYFDGNESYADNVTGGYMRFKYADGKLWTITEYESDTELSDEELNELGDYTQGQWSDGIGEGFEQEPVCIEDGVEAYISAWFHGQKLEITQEAIDE